MKYFGGKSLSSVEISNFLKSVRKPNQTYIEPFIGGASVFIKMENPREGYDFGHHLINLWQGVRDGTFSYPSTKSITEEVYKELRGRRNQTEPDGLLAFVGYGMSFAAKYFAGYARNATHTDYQLGCENSCKKKAPFLQGAVLGCADYKTLNPENSLIYCDPPYANTTAYAVSGKFDSAEFWQVMTKWANNNNDIYVSEYVAPNLPNIQEVWSKQHKLSVRSKEGCAKRVEKLFKVNPI